jgi:hypothetical protein
MPDPSLIQKSRDAAGRLFPKRQILAAYAFGSRVAGTPRPGSDLDIGYYLHGYRRETTWNDSAKRLPAMIGGIDVCGRLVDPIDRPQFSLSENRMGRLTQTATGSFLHRAGLNTA